MVHVTAFFAGLLAFIYIGLSINVIRGRYGARIALGDGGDKAMIRKIRTHANFAEYVPLALVLMALDELNGKPQWLLYIFGVALVIARLSHAYSLLVAEVAREDRIVFRSIGVATTFTVILALAIMAIA